MRVLLDMQGAQGASRSSGVGRYLRGLAHGMARARGGRELHLLVNARLRESAARLVEEFTPILGREALHLFTPPEGCAAGDNPQSPRRRLAELLRAEAVHDATPDLLLVGSVFEGWRDEAVTTWPASLQRPHTAAVLYDLIPLSLRPMYLDGLWREAGLLPWYFRALDEVAQAETLLCLSEATREEALRHLRKPQERLAVLGGGVEPHFVPPAVPDPGLPARYGLPPGYLLFLGAGDPRKNEGVLLDALALLPPALRARHPLAIGHVNPPHLRAMAEARGLTPREVITLPFVAEADLPGLYAQCALLVFPSLAEGLGLPLMEAMACGAPVISSNLSAMPEVMGRADALFDPNDAPALARMIEALLRDPDRLAEMRAYGLRRAREFSWDAAAARAWPALDAMGARRGYWRPLPRPRLALVAPLPPAPTGIADYTAELAPALAPHYAVTLVSDTPPEGALRGRFPWMPETEFLAEGGRFDRILYQVGNNALHASTLRRLLPRHPGMVTLHDPVLTDLRNWMLTDRAEREAALARRVEEEGYPAALSGQPGAGSAGVLAQALGVLVHSAHARRKLQEEYGAEATRHVRVLPHLRAGSALPSAARARRLAGIGRGALVVAAFGLVTARKGPLELLAAFARIATQFPEARLVFVGGAQDALDQRISDMARRLNLASRVMVTGRLPLRDYRRWLAAADLAVQLRADSTGETSGAVKDALMAGLPVVVNAHGAMAELPEEACQVIPDAFTETELAEAIARLLASREARLSLGRAGQAWARATLAPEEVGRRHRQHIEEAYLFGPGAGGHDVTRWAAELPLSAEDAAAGGVAIARAWTGARRPRLWLDTAAPGFEPGLLALLREGAGRFRPEPCRLAPGGFVTDHGWAWGKLGLPGLPPAEGPAALTPSDALLTAAPAGGEAALIAGCRLLAPPPAGAGEAQRAAVLERLSHE
ncbi:MAG TPA: glycosyltransferase [Roseococcus sp.]|jgi:glycosyltransferase involved in cell wall biosynthesis|nr:glycosyltransferase [Roseococcus sp.]